MFTSSVAQPPDGHNHSDDKAATVQTTPTPAPKPHEAVIEQYQGHVHHQINVQVVHEENTLSVQVDFPSGDMKEKTPENFLKIRTPSQHFNTSEIDKHCKIKTTSFDTKAFGNGHSDYFISFEYDCDPKMNLSKVDLNPLFGLPVDLEKAVTNIIIGNQVLPQVTLKKQNAIVKIKKK